MPDSDAVLGASSIPASIPGSSVSSILVRIAIDSGLIQKPRSSQASAIEAGDSRQASASMAYLLLRLSSACGQPLVGSLPVLSSDHLISNLLLSKSSKPIRQEIVY